jgi:sulfur carrier protein ThiS
MEIEVKMGDPLWKTVGRREIRLQIGEGATVAEALDRLQNLYPGFASALAAGGTRLGIPFNFFVNRKLVKDSRLGEHRLKAGDTLYILAPIVGGGAGAGAGRR